MASLREWSVRPEVPVPLDLVPSKAMICVLVNNALPHCHRNAGERTGIGRRDPPLNLHLINLPETPPLICTTKPASSRRGFCTRFREEVGLPHGVRATAYGLSFRYAYSS